MLLGVRYANFDLAATHAQHRDLDVMVNPDGFASLPLNVKHKVLLVRYVFITSCESTIPRPKKTHRSGGLRFGLSQSFIGPRRSLNTVALCPQSSRSSMCPRSALTANIVPSNSTRK